MSITAILIGIGALIAAIFGGVAGHGIGKSSGRKEGAQQAQAQQEIIQAKAITESVQERQHVEAEIRSAADDDLDSRLSKHSRPD